MKKDGLTRESKIREAAERLARSEGPSLDPAILFLHASDDDIAAYDAMGLAAAGRHAGAELAAYDWKNPRVTCRPMEGDPSGKLYVVSVTTRNMPFLYDSVMGEVTASTATSPWRCFRSSSWNLARPARLPSRRPVPPEHRLSHIQIHLVHVSPSETDALVDRIRTVLKHVQLSSATGSRCWRSSTARSVNSRPMTAGGEWPNATRRWHSLPG